MKLPTSRTLPAGWQFFAGPYGRNESTALHEHVASIIAAGQFAESDLMIVIQKAGPEQQRHIACRESAIKNNGFLEKERVKAPKPERAGRFA